MYSGVGELAPWRVGPPEQRRRVQNGLRAVRGRARDRGRAAAGPRGLARQARAGPPRRAVAGLARSGRGGWEMGRALVGLEKEKVALGRAAGGGRGGEGGRGGPAEWAREGGKLISFLFFLSLFLLFQFDIM
jgi:hypothetical protein